MADFRDEPENSRLSPRRGRTAADLHLMQDSRHSLRSARIFAHIDAPIKYLADGVDEFLLQLFPPAFHQRNPRANIEAPAATVRPVALFLPECVPLVSPEENVRRTTRGRLW